MQCVCDYGLWSFCLQYDGVVDDSPIHLVFFQRTMVQKWRPTFRMLIRSLDGQWSCDPLFEEDHFMGEVRFSISPVSREPHIPLFYFDLLLVLTQYPILDYICVPATPPSSSSHSPSSMASIADIAMMVEEMFAQSTLLGSMFHQPLIERFLHLPIHRIIQSHIHDFSCPNI